MAQPTKATNESESVDKICRRLRTAVLADCYVGIGLGFGFYIFGLLAVLSIEVIEGLVLGVFGYIVRVSIGGILAATLSAMAAGWCGVICCGLTVLVLRTLNIAVHPVRIASTAGGLAAYTLLVPAFVGVVFHGEMVAVFYFVVGPVLAMLVTQVGAAYFAQAQLRRQIRFEAYKNGVAIEDIEAGLVSTGLPYQFDLRQIGIFSVWFAIALALLRLVSVDAVIWGLGLFLVWLVVNIPMSRCVPMLVEWFVSLSANRLLAFRRPE